MGGADGVQVSPKASALVGMSCGDGSPSIGRPHSSLAPSSSGESGSDLCSTRAQSLNVLEDNCRG